MSVTHLKDIGDGEGSPAPAIADVFHGVGNGDVRDVFHALVTELAGDLHANGSAVIDGQLPAVHAVGEKGLRMPGVGHVNAVPPKSVQRIVDNILRLRDRKSTRLNSSHGYI